MAWGSWGEVPAGEQNLLDDLRNQWEQLDGWARPISDEQLLAAANAGVVDLHGFAQHLWKSGLQDFDKPWTGVGVTRDQWLATLTAYADQWQRLTGQELDVTQMSGDPSAWAPGGAPAGKTFWEAISKGLTPGELGHNLTLSAEMQKTYGWIKYGLDYRGFEEQKLGMRQSFGRELTDAEGIQQLSYFHANAGGSHEVHGEKQKQPDEGQAVIR